MIPENKVPKTFAKHFYSVYSVFLATYNLRDTTPGNWHSAQLNCITNFNCDTSIIKKLKPKPKWAISADKYVLKRIDN